MANIRCAEIMEDQLRALTADQAWEGLREGAAAGIVEGFGGRVEALFDSCIKGWVCCTQTEWKRPFQTVNHTVAWDVGVGIAD